VNNYYQEEEILGKAYDSRLMKRLLRYLKPYKFSAVTGLLFLIISSFCELIGPILIKIGIDRYITNKDYLGLKNIALLYIGFITAGFLFGFFHNYIMEMVGQKIMYDMRKQMFTRLQSYSVSFFDKNPVGRLMTRLTNDVDTLNEMFTSGVITIFNDVFVILGIIVILVSLNVKLALITFSVLPLLFYATFLFRKKVRETYRQIRVRIARINAFLQENITGMKIVQLFNREKRNFREFDKLNKDHMNAFLKTIFYYSLFFPGVEIISSLAIALIIWYGGSHVIQGTLTFGALIAFIQYAQRFYRPIQDLSEKYNIMQSAMASSERIFKLLDEEKIIPESDKPVEMNRKCCSIEFRNVWFAYNDKDYVLKDISFSVKQGEKIAIVGATGAGKTTIINLLCRFYDVTKGEICIDDINIREFSKESLRKNIGIVLQDVFLFSGTIRDNISLGNTGIPEKKIIASCTEVNADKFISHMPQQYDEEIMERGDNLSTGQKQLIAFARALSYDPQILVLDEATSNIDTETEILIQQALKTLMEGRTSIIIAHRLSTIQNADHIIVMHKGEIRERGTHQQLLKKRGLYYKLYELQYKNNRVPDSIRNSAHESSKHGG